jgi:hypothetical protein
VYQGALTCTPGSLTVFSNAASGTSNPTGIAIQNPAAVPEPGAVALLLGTATTGLLMLSRRRKSA